MNYLDTDLIPPKFDDGLIPHIHYDLRGSFVTAKFDKFKETLINICKNDKKFIAIQAAGFDCDVHLSFDGHTDLIEPIVN